MALSRRSLVRLIETRAGPRYVVQVPHDRCLTPGWRAYALLALGLDGEPPIRLTLYERTDERPDDRDGPRAA
ncbi:MAG: hypothetical protein GEU75_16295 [Dehalococcoidia bacterium]|nr:hypothetical protein [Dehalococcoidia bacterium]